MPHGVQTNDAPQLGEETISHAEEQFEKWRRRSGIVLAPLAMLVTSLLTKPHLSPQRSTLSAILATTGILWVTETVPLPVTALLGALLCILLGVAPAQTVLAPFANPIVFLFIGSFMLAQAMMIHGLDRRIALGFLATPGVGGGPIRVMAALGFITALISMWVSNTATTAMMLPIALGILRALHTARGHAGDLSHRNWPYATGLMLMVAYAASVGGIGTPVGSPPNLIAVGQLRNTAVDTGFFTTQTFEVGFFQWMAVTVPLLSVMFLVLVGLLYLLHRDRGAHDPLRSADRLAHYLKSERARLGRWTPGQINTALVFALTVTLWVLPGSVGLVAGDHHRLTKLLEARLPESAVALIAAALLFILPTSLRNMQFTLTWKQAVNIDWGTILLFGGGISLGGLMFSTGVAEAMGRSITWILGVQSLWGITAVAIAVGILLSESTSNTAAANMVVPIFIALATTAGVNPIPPVMGACLGASYGFMLPVSTPPNAVVYSSGLVPIPKMIRAGFLFDLIGFAIILAGLYLLCPLMGWTQPLYQG